MKSGELGSMNMIGSGINSRTAPMRSGIRKDLKIRIIGEKKRSYKITDY